MSPSRRDFLAGLATTGALAAASRSARALAGCPFRLSVINDEISQDFDHSCYVASRVFGLNWIELRGMWNKNITELNADEIAQSRKILAKYSLRVTDIASPLFKVDWPGAPPSRFSPRHGEFHADFDFKQQNALRDRCIDLCKTFETDRLRCFDFWRLDDVKPWRAAINAKLDETASVFAKHKVILLLENEMDCNTGSGKEAAATLAAIPNPNLMLNWDLGNSATFPGDVPYPTDYDLLPKHRIGHCHCKDTIRKPDGKAVWAPVGGGIIDWVGQFRAFMRQGYHYAVSLETHWRGATPPPGSGMSVAEASSRISMKGLKEDLAKAGASC
ncbi:MAG TPA: sugar phosphate isomerase/epimerase family protein [Terracidiphilus sp.]|nr:sugar phosphate isomerase/epimerase family protein [Terracidiphilus sp.]